MAFLDWLHSRENVDPTIPIGTKGKNIEVGGGQRARVDSLRRAAVEAQRYAQAVIGEDGTYSSQLTLLNLDGHGWAQLDVHAPLETSRFGAPALLPKLVKAAEAANARLYGALRVLKCIDFVSDVGGVDEASQDVVVEVAEAEDDAA